MKFNKESELTLRFQMLEEECCYLEIGPSLSEGYGLDIRDLQW